MAEPSGSRGQETASSLTFSSGSCPLLAPQKDLGDGFSWKPEWVTFMVSARCGWQSRRLPSPYLKYEQDPKTTSSLVS